MRNREFLMIVGAAALLGNSPARGAEVSQEVEVNLQQKDINSPEAKFEEYEEIPNGIILEDYYLKSTGEKADVEVEVKDLRLEQQSAGFKIRGNKTTLKGSWDQVPHLYSNEARTLYTETAAGVLRLPDQLQSTLQTNATTTTGYVTLMSDFLTGAHAVDLKTRTDTGKFSVNREFNDRWKGELGFSKREKSGHRALGAAFGFNHIVEVALPVDENTYDSDLSLNYLGKTVQTGLHYNFSSYQNDVDNLTWDNPKRVTDRYTNSSGYSSGDQSSQGRMSLSPDNVAHNALLTAGVKLPLRSRITANIGFNHHSQNQSLLPYTINSAINPSTSLTGSSLPPFDASNPANRPADEVNAKIITWTQNYDLSTNWTKKVTSKLKFDSIQTNNRTPELVMPGRARVDQTWAVGSLNNHAYEGRTDGLEGVLNWNVCSGFRTNAGYGVKWVQREHREVEETEEATAKIGFEVDPWKHTRIRANYLNAKREMEEFDTLEQVGAGEIPGLRRVDVADRTRNQGRLNMNTRAGRFGIGLNGSLGHDDYEPGKGDLTGGVAGNANQMYGVQEVRSAGAGVDLDADYDRFAFFLFYSFEQAKSNQRSVENNTSAAVQVGTASWVMENNDRYDSFGIGMDIYAIKNLVDLKIGYDLDRSVGVTDITDKGALNKINPPETRTSKQDYYVQGFVKVNPNLTFKLAYLFEKYDISDYAHENLDLVEGSAAGQANIFLGDSVHDYKAHVYSVGVIYKFGNTVQ